MAGPRAAGSTLYCTLEPCSHVGRTGPCVARIADAGIVRVVASMADPNPLVGGRGFAFLEEHGIAVEVGPGAERAAAINQPFLIRTREQRPFVILKAAVSTDGFLAAEPGRRTVLTAAAANRHAHLRRAEVDAIGVGVNTVLADDPLLTVRGVFRERPLVRVVFDRNLRTPAAARLLSTLDAGPVMIVTTPAGAAQEKRVEALAARGAVIEVVEADGLRPMLERLAKREVGSLVLEGGPALHRAAWDEGVVDFVSLYVTPHVIGATARAAAADRLRLLQGAPLNTSALVERRVVPLGPDVLIEGYVHRPH
jgi:diaminohydroxyphosphoribosylaminopyrimidine deaminase/5-amino-6-(5-phosphoribosylamino)uracil reductase